MKANDVIARLRELRAKATAGEWCAPDASEGDVWAVTVNGEPFIPLMRSERGNYKSWGKSLTNDDRKANAAAIVAAMNSLEPLLACASALQVLATTASRYRELVDNDAGHGLTGPAFTSLYNAENKARLALQALAEGGA